MSKALALLTLPLALLLTWLQVRPQAPLSVVSAGPAAACRPSAPTPIGAQWNGRDARLLTSGFLRWRVCGPGTLSFSAVGSVANGAGATLLVSWKDRTLLETEARGRQPYRVAVPGAGWVLLSFPNDLYRPPQDRNLFLYNVEFKSSEFKSLEP